LAQLAPYRKRIEAIAVESTYNWYWLVDGLQSAGYEVQLVHTSALKVYEGMKYTDDRHDARHLAHLLRLGLLPKGYIYPKARRAVRDLLRKRSQLVRQRTAQVLSLKNLWSRNTGTTLSTYDAKTGGSRREEPEANRALAIASTQQVLACLNEQIHRIELSILRQVRGHEGWRLLMTVPGVGKLLAMTIYLELGEIGRFRKAGNFASYCRCVRSIRTSNEKKKGSGNRKNGNRYLGWAFIEAANFAIRHDARIKGFYQRKLRRTKRVVALKAVAHKLTKACFHILRDGVPFDVAQAFA
jgi:transposase